MADLTVSVPWEGAEPLQAPVKEGTNLGRVSVSLDGRTLGTVGVVTASEMGLSIPDFVIWWVTSDPVHMGVVAGGAAAFFVLVGTVAALASRARRKDRDAAQVTVAPGHGRHSR